MVNFKSSGFDKGTRGKSGKFQFDCDGCILFTRRSINTVKIPKISPRAYIFQRPFLRGLFLEGLIFGEAYLGREICVSKSIGLAL